MGAILADCYDSLNRLFGTPMQVALDSNGTPFQQTTIPLLDEIASYATSDARVLLIGCGDGMEIEWFAKRCASVVAVDVDKYTIDRVTNRTSEFHNFSAQLIDGCTLPFADNQFDIVFMHNVCEHIINLKDCFTEYFRVLRLGKVLINAFAPLFFSPYGAHLQYALKVPWGHLIFGVRAVVDVRNRYYPGHCVASTWEGLGLNRVTERQYRKIVKAAGFKIRVYDIRTSKSLPLVAHIPLIRNLFILSIKSILVKTEQQLNRRNETLAALRQIRCLIRVISKLVMVTWRLGFRCSQCARHSVTAMEPEPMRP